MRRPAGARRGRRSGRRRRALPLRDHADAHLIPAAAIAPLTHHHPHQLTLQLEQFRNFPALDWSSPGERLLLVGPNGAGKTTLLEALYLAVTGRSFRAPRLEHCARRGSDGFAVAAALGALPRRDLRLEWRRGQGSERTLDGKRATPAEALAAWPLLVWTHAESELVGGPPALRRRFFDRALVQLRPALLASLGRHERAMGEKRALLAAGGGARQLDSWNELLARHGAEIATGRARLVSEVGGTLERLRRESFADLPPLGLRYLPSPPAAVDGEAALFAALSEHAAAERERGQPLVGAQRDEVEIGWGDVEARRTASAGERKAVGVLLLAALAARLGESGREPALLVDDADTELDRGRVERLSTLLGGFRRVLLSSNRPEVWPASAGLERVDVGGLARGASGGS